MYRLLFLNILIIINFHLLGQINYEYRYWFDSETDSIFFEHSNSNILQTNLNVEHLDIGFHSFHVQVKDSSNKWSSPLSKYFIKILPHSNIINYYYWFDNDIVNIRENDFNNGIAILDVEHLSEGIHTLNMQINYGNIYSETNTSIFYKVPQIKGIDSLFYVAKINNEIFKQEKVSISNGIIHWNLDVSSLKQGFYFMQIFSVTPLGVATDMKDLIFYRPAKTEEIGDLKFCYSIDNGEVLSIDDISLSNISLFNIDVSNISEGFHQITYFITNDKAKTSSSKSALFYKTPIGGNGIKEYIYWFNNNYDDRKIIKLSEHQITYNLITLLPTDTCPIRSSCFHFEVRDSVPMVFAKNDFYLRFFDTSNRCVDLTKQYIDYNVKEEITDITELEESGTYKFARPEENKIKWFKFEAKTGDSISLYTNKMSTFEVFNANNNERIYTKTSNKSIEANGFYAPEDGSYYVAVHDVVQNENEVSLYYSHINRYAVIDYDVHRVGNGGISTINLFGNGFYSLDSVVLNNSGIKIDCLNITTTSNNYTALSFDFNNQKVGQCDLILYYKEDSVVINNFVTIEDAVNITISSDIDYNTTFLAGTTTKYKIKVTNNGNMSAYRVPIYTYIESPESDGVGKIKFHGMNLPNVLKSFDYSDFSDVEVAQLYDYIEQMADNHYFIKTKKINEETGDSIICRTGYFFTNIPPYTTQEFVLEIETTNPISVYFTIPENWTELLIAEGITDAKGRKYVQSRARNNHFCCYLERYQCVINLIGVGLNAAELCTQCNIAVSSALAIVNCVYGNLNTMFTELSNLYCASEEQNDENFLNTFMNYSDGVSIANTVYNCVFGCLVNELTGPIADFWKIVNYVNDWAIQLTATKVNCFTAFVSKKPNCPPGDPKGGNSKPVASYDPNDIIGYTSEAGNEYVGIDRKSLWYTIEFENDTTFATASAHKVVIKDTLDKNIFDLNSIEPTNITIGNKSYNVSGTLPFVMTIDMRPRINVITQVTTECDYEIGELLWTLQSLDPMTMEPTEDVMSGFLPINTDSTGLGSVSFNISLKEGLEDGAEIENYADIIFDNNEPIVTPVWYNETDYVRPIGKIKSIDIIDRSNININFMGIDERSGIWKYDLYTQVGTDAQWELVAENITDSSCSYSVSDNIEYGFCVIATDSAGNREIKDLVSEYTYYNGGIITSNPVIEQENIVQDDILYDILGRRVKNPIVPGIYIKNGKKVFIRE